MGKYCWHKGLGVARVGCFSADLWVPASLCRKHLRRVQK